MASHAELLEAPVVVGPRRDEADEQHERERVVVHSKLPSGEEFNLDAKATRDPGEIRPVDLVWLCVKTYDTDAAAEQIRPMVGPETMIASIQNGVDNERKIEGIFGPGILFPASAMLMG